MPAVIAVEPEIDSTDAQGVYLAVKFAKAAFNGRCVSIPPLTGEKDRLLGEG